MLNQALNKKVVQKVHPPKDVKVNILRKRCNLRIVNTCKTCKNYDDCIRYSAWRKSKAEEFEKKVQQHIAKSRAEKRPINDSAEDGSFDD